MSDSAESYPAFRRRLDDVLRQRNPAALRAFLIAEGQWTEATATDPESAMWMMIATSPALANLRDESQRWLMSHGHEAEAQAIFGAKRSPGKPAGSKPQSRSGHSRAQSPKDQPPRNTGASNARGGKKRPRR
jgi:hypothetical protein